MPTAAGRRARRAASAARSAGAAVGARTGYEVIARGASLHGSRSAAVRPEISRRQGGDAESDLVLDVSDPQAIAAALAGVDVEVLVNNAGVGVLKPFMELTRRRVDADGRRQLQRAVRRDARRAPGDDRAEESGHIVIIGSIAGRSAFVGGTCYAATKHAVMGFTRVPHARGARLGGEGVGRESGLGGDELRLRRATTTGSLPPTMWPTPSRTVSRRRRTSSSIGWKCAR